MIARPAFPAPQNDFMANNQNYKIIFKCEPKNGTPNHDFDHNYMSTTTTYRALPLPVPVLHQNIALPVPNNVQL